MFNALDMGPDGGLRALLLALLALADLGNRPGRRCMLEGGNRARRQLPFVKSTEARVAKTAQWLAAGRSHASAPMKTRRRRPRRRRRRSPHPSKSQAQRQAQQQSGSHVRKKKSQQAAAKKHYAKTSQA